MRRLIAPAVLVAILAVASIGVSYRIYSAHVVWRCTALRMIKDAPAADVVIVGSSRISSAIDPIFLETLLSDRNGRQIDVERMSATGAELGYWIGLADAYVRNRGYPKIVLIEWSHRVPSGHESERSTLFTTAARSLELQAKQSDLDEKNPTSWLEKTFSFERLRWPTIVLQQAAAGFYGVVNISHRLRAEQPFFCTSEDEWTTWPYDDVDADDLLDSATELPSEKKWRQIRKDRAERDDALTRVDVTARRRQASNLLMSELMTTLNNSSTKFYLVVVPHFEDDWTPDQSAALVKVFPEAEVIDLVNFIATAEDGRLNLAWRNVSHLNFTAAAFVTQHIADILPDLP